MTISLRRLEANRRNALRSTGPRTQQRSRANAVRHGLTAETVVANLEDAEDYQAFEAGVISDFDPETAVARELVLRLASLLWRLRRANAIESNLFEIQAEDLQERGASVPTRAHATDPTSSPGLRPFDRSTGVSRGDQLRSAIDEIEERLGDHELSSIDYKTTTRQLTYCFLRLANLDSGVFERLSRYEAALWRQTVRTLIALHPIRNR